MTADEQDPSDHPSEQRHGGGPTDGAGDQPGGAPTDGASHQPGARGRPETGRPDQRSRWRTAAAIGAVLLAVVLLLVGTLGTSGGRVIDVEVPPGTAARITAGEPVELLPRRLEVRVGDRLEIVNRDVETHQVGPYTVSAGQTLRQQFTTPGTLQGACTLHPSGDITIVVR